MKLQAMAGLCARIRARNRPAAQKCGARPPALVDTSGSGAVILRQEFSRWNEVQGEWAMICLTHNILKLHRLCYGSSYYILCGIDLRGGEISIEEREYPEHDNEEDARFWLFLFGRASQRDGVLCGNPDNSLRYPPNDWIYRRTCLGGVSCRADDDGCGRILHCPQPIERGLRPRS
jgi:hypothetical protein